MGGQDNQSRDLERVGESRRDFLKGSCVIAVGMAAAGKAQQPGSN